LTTNDKSGKAVAASGINGAPLPRSSPGAGSSPDFIDVYAETKIDFLTDLAAIEQQLTQLIRAASLLSVAPTVAPDDPANQAHNATWTPSIDIYETTGEFVLTAPEVPGVKNSDIDIKVIQETPVLRGERRWEPEADHELYHRLESSYGQVRAQLPALSDRSMPNGSRPNSNTAS
jgi:HSP20 family molecular chaperone IbpA